MFQPMTQALRTSPTSSVPVEPYRQLVRDLPPSLPTIPEESRQPEKPQSPDELLDGPDGIHGEDLSDERAFPKPNKEPHDDTNADPRRHPSPRLLTLRESYKKAAMENFVRSGCSPRVQALINEPNGKENINQSFRTEATLRHCMLPLWKSGFLTESDWSTFARASSEATSFRSLIDEFGDVDFNDLRGYPDDWENMTEVDPHRVKMATAALLFFDGDAASLVRWIGGPHVNAHRNVPEMLRYLKGKIPDDVYDDCERIYKMGIPRHCNADSSEKNFQAFYKYGNHSSCDTDPQQSYKALVKDAKKGFVLPFDKRVIPFILNCHMTPQGMVDLDNKYKSSRVIFDSSFRPAHDSVAINDMTHPSRENPVICVAIEEEFMKNLWDTRISEEFAEIYLSDDDVSGAFRWLKYNPNLVALHTSIQCGFGVFNTGGTFGDNTTPSNWDRIALARAWLARWLWLNEPNVIEMAGKHMPEIKFTPDPTPEEVATFAKATRDSRYHGIYNDDGTRKPPAFLHHVDDCAKADTKATMKRTIACSIVSLFKVLGEPTPYIQNPLSLPKFINLHSGMRQIVGRYWDTRRLSVGMLAHKRDELISRLNDWLPKERFSLLEAAELLGVLENHTRYCRWARPWFYALQNRMRDLLDRLYFVQKRIWQRIGPKKERQIRDELPAAQWSRVKNIMAREKALLLWRSKATQKMDRHLKVSLSNILHYLETEERPFEAKIGAIIPRDPHAITWGDASTYGAGGYSPQLKFWFDIVWSPQVRRGLKLPEDDPAFIHINQLEFLTVILELAASIVAFKELSEEEKAVVFPYGVPEIPVLLTWSDNKSSVSWGNKATTKSIQGQRLLGIYCELLRTSGISVSTDYIPGEENIIADFISRPTHFDLSHAERAEQLYQKHSFMRGWRSFLPSPELLRLLSSSLHSKSPMVAPSLPSELGRLVPTKSISSNSVMI